MHPSAFRPGITPPIGALDKRITIQQESTTQDAVGGPVLTWVDVATIWAHVHPLAGHELINAQSVYAEITHQIIIRWQTIFANPQTVAAMRVVYAGRHFAIGSSIEIDDAHRWIILSVAEGIIDR